MVNCLKNKCFVKIEQSQTFIGFKRKTSVQVSTIDWVIEGENHWSKAIIKLTLGLELLCVGFISVEQILWITGIGYGLQLFFPSSLLNARQIYRYLTPQMNYPLCYQITASFLTKITYQCIGAKSFLNKQQYFMHFRPNSPMFS